MIVEYLRRKRIRRIRRFYSQLQSWGLVVVDGVAADVSNRKPILVSRDAVLHFAFTVASLIALGAVVGPVTQFLPLGGLGGAVRLIAMVAVAVGAVECADFAMDRLSRAFDITFDYVLPIAGLILLLSVVIGLRLFGTGPAWMASARDWRDRVNARVQSRPVANHVDPAVGTNWFFVRTDDGAMQPLDRVDAAVACESKGAGWQLYDADSSFVPDPTPTVARGFSVWFEGNFPVAQLSAGAGFPRSGVFRSAGPGDKVITLCIRKGS